MAELGGVARGASDSKARAGEEVLDGSIHVLITHCFRCLCLSRSDEGMSEYDVIEGLRSLELMLCRGFDFLPSLHEQVRMLEYDPGRYIVHSTSGRAPPVLTTSHYTEAFYDVYNE